MLKALPDDKRADLNALAADREQVVRVVAEPRHVAGARQYSPGKGAVDGSAAAHGLAMHPAGSLNPGKRRARGERDLVQCKRMCRDC